jgi:hypothetical protein
MRDRTGSSESIRADGYYTGTYGPILDLRIRFGSGPWRMGAAWAVIAGALAANALSPGSENLLRLAGSILLADVAWGATWPVLPRSDRLPDGLRRSRLPYSAPQAPMEKVLAGLVNGGSKEEAGGWEGALPGLVLTAILSVLLGSPAIILSLVAFGAAGSARILIARNRWPAFLMGLLGVGLPWLLGVSLTWSQGLHRSVVQFDASLALGTAFTVLAWMSCRVRSADASSSVWPAWLGQVAVLGTLAVLEEPLAVAVVGSFMVVPTLWFSKQGGSPQGVLAAMAKSDPWWLGAMLVAALIVHS